jgi:hypothetical protein
VILSSNIHTANLSNAVTAACFYIIYTKVEATLVVVIHLACYTAFSIIIIIMVMVEVTLSNMLLFFGMILPTIGKKEQYSDQAQCSTVELHVWKSM